MTKYVGKNWVLSLYVKEITRQVAFHKQNMTSFASFLCNLIGNYASGEAYAVCSSIECQSLL